ncbi:MAG: hypothetical protein QHG99_07330 [Methanomicrobiales archaeon]|nr:hypothetical protein [Methanomicrobiales archaeon]
MAIVAPEPQYADPPAAPEAKEGEITEQEMKDRIEEVFNQVGIRRWRGSQRSYSTLFLCRRGRSLAIEDIAEMTILYTVIFFRHDIRNPDELYIC